MYRNTFSTKLNQVNQFSLNGSPKSIEDSFSLRTIEVTNSGGKIKWPSILLDPFKCERNVCHHCAQIEVVFLRIFLSPDTDTIDWSSFKIRRHKTPRRTFYFFAVLYFLSLQTLVHVIRTFAASIRFHLSPNRITKLKNSNDSKKPKIPLYVLKFKFIFKLYLLLFFIYEQNLFPCTSKIGHFLPLSSPPKMIHFFLAILRTTTRVRIN